jgi:hypothetical protein
MKPDKFKLRLDCAICRTETNTRSLSGVGCHPQVGRPFRVKHWAGVVRSRHFVLSAQDQLLFRFVRACLC